MKNGLIHEMFVSGLSKSLIGIAVVLFFGTLGYVLIEGWDLMDSFYMTVITVSTVGITEVHPLSHTGRLFTSVLIFCGVGVMAYSLSRMAEFIFQRSITNALGRRSMTKKINQMKNHIIICGYGRTGSRVVAELQNAGKPFVVIEGDDEQGKRMEELGIPHIVGDATEEETLEEANIEHAEALVAGLGSDAENLFLTITAKGIAHDIRIIARVHDPDNTRKLKKAGAHRVVSPISSGASQIAQLLIRSSVVDLVELAATDKSIALEVFEHVIDENSELRGKTLAEARVHQTLGALVIAIRHTDGSNAFDPSPNTRLGVGDILVAIRKPDEGEDTL